MCIYTHTNLSHYRVKYYKNNNNKSLEMQRKLFASREIFLMAGTTKFPRFGSTLLEYKVFGEQLDGPSVL